MKLPTQAPTAVRGHIPGPSRGRDSAGARPACHCPGGYYQCNCTPSNYTCCANGVGCAIDPVSGLCKCDS